MLMFSKRTIIYLLFCSLAVTPLKAQEERDETRADLPDGTVFSSDSLAEDSAQMQRVLIALDRPVRIPRRTAGETAVFSDSRSSV